MEMGVLKPDDSVVWLSVTAAPLPEAGQGVVVTYGDITARKQAEDALRESEEKYRNLFNNSEVGMFRVRLDGSEILEFNEKYLKILNYTAEELKGQSSANLWADERERNIMMQLLNAQGYATDFECRMLSKQGDVRKCVMSVRLYRDTEILEGSIQDITERRRIEDSLRESEERYRTVVFHAPVVTFVTDEKGVFTLSEGKGLAKLGLQPGQVVGMSVFDVYRDYPTILNAMKNALAGQHQRDESSVQGIVFDVFYTPVFDQQDKVVKVIGVANDVTERKQSENKIYQLNLELEQRVRARTAQLETTNKELETFSYSVSHDLRAPLRGIDGWSQALLEDYYDQLDGQGRQYIDRVRSETQRMGHLIDDMLQLSRLTRAEIVKEKVDLSALAQVIVERIKRNEPLRQLDFNIHAGLTAEGDTHLLEAALVNLLENAFKFTSKRADARIEFGQMNLQGQRVFFVRDNGAGFDMTYAQKLFGAFQRMHTFSEFPGTGIGLATVQRIIHRHGGRVWAEAEIERGATFYFTLE
jgi:PAS domain S-box-containing protein